MAFVNADDPDDHFVVSVAEDWSCRIWSGTTANKQMTTYHAHKGRRAGGATEQSEYRSFPKTHESLILLTLLSLPLILDALLLPNEQHTMNGYSYHPNNHHVLLPNPMRPKNQPQ